MLCARFYLGLSNESGNQCIFNFLICTHYSGLFAVSYGKLQELQSTVPLLYLVSLLHGVSLGLPVLTISATSHRIQGKDATLATPFTASLRASEFRLADTAVPMCRPRVQPSHLPWAACHGDRLLGAQTRCRNSILFT